MASYFRISRRTLLTFWSHILATNFLPSSLCCPCCSLKDPVIKFTYTTTMKHLQSAIHDAHSRVQGLVEALESRDLRRLYELQIKRLFNAWAAIHMHESIWHYYSVHDLLMQFTSPSKLMDCERWLICYQSQISRIQNLEGRYSIAKAARLLPVYQVADEELPEYEVFENPPPYAQSVSTTSIYDYPGS